MVLGIGSIPSFKVNPLSWKYAALALEISQKHTKAYGFLGNIIIHSTLPNLEKTGIKSS